jgi:ABC-type microcin C transport system duplicated ATPase subunit YejF
MMSLSPVHTVGNQIMEAILLHQNVSKDKAKEQAIEVLDLAGMPQLARTLDQYPYELSGGMRQRCIIAMALSCHPSLLIADEPTTALDVTTEAQILKIMRGLQDELGMAIMYITHNLGVIAQMADEVAVCTWARSSSRRMWTPSFTTPGILTRARCCSPSPPGPKDARPAAAGIHPRHGARSLCAAAGVLVQPPL